MMQGCNLMLQGGRCRVYWEPVEGVPRGAAHLGGGPRGDSCRNIWRRQLHLGHQLHSPRYTLTVYPPPRGDSSSPP